MAATIEKEIWSLRNQGRLEEAIQLCEREAARHLDVLLFPKLACDLNLTAGRPQDAGRWVLEMLLRMWQAGSSFFREFAWRFQRVISRLQPHQKADLVQRLQKMIQQGRVHRRLVPRCEELLAHLSIETANQSHVSPPNSREVVLPKAPLRTVASLDGDFGNVGSKSSKEPEFLHNLVEGGMSPTRLFALAKKMGAEEPQELERCIHDAPLRILHSEKFKHLFDYLVAFLERKERLEEALRLLETHPSVHIPSQTQASFFRVCRNLGRFDKSQRFLEEHPISVPITQIPFSVLYELVYFYEAQNDLQRAKEILEGIRKHYETTEPVLATLRNFYLRFGMFSDAGNVDALLTELRKGRRGSKYRAAVTELQAEVFTDLEHQRQLAALSDLTNGISHELGQPITNIRYTIQLYRRQLEKNLTADLVFTVFDTVLHETERMGGLVKRLAPITSSRRVIEEFDAVARVKGRVDSERARLSVRNIEVDLVARGPITVKADPVRFDQIISNLLLNSIDAISEFPASHKGRIRILMGFETGKRTVRITFEDNGPGIAQEHRRKVFEPFFSTKAPGKGEGLGLFIVWNLMKMQGGSISLDSTYHNGTRFVVLLPTEAKPNPKPIEP